MIVHSFRKMICILCFIFLGATAYSIEKIELVSEKKILVCGVIRNGEKGFRNSKNSISELVKNFKDYRIIVYENNSQDNTKKLYADWANEEKKLIFISEDLSSFYLNCYTPKIGDFRFEFIARARNIVIAKALEEQYDDFDYIMMADLDEFEPWDIKSIIETIENPEQEWDMVSANGSYDLRAVRSDKFRLSPELIGWSMWCDMQPIIGKKYAELLKNSGWYKVESAFGGLAIYKRDAFFGARYKGMISPSYLYYLLEVDYSKDLIYRESPGEFKRKIQQTLMKFVNWERNVFSERFMPQNAYVSDHVQLHYQMISNGHNKLFVNPKWKHLSKTHRNY